MPKIAVLLSPKYNSPWVVTWIGLAEFYASPRPLQLLRALLDPHVPFTHFLSGSVLILSCADNLQYEKTRQGDRRCFHLPGVVTSRTATVHDACFLIPPPPPDCLRLLFCTTWTTLWGCASGFRSPRGSGRIASSTRRPILAHIRIKHGDSTRETLWSHIFFIYLSSRLSKKYASSFDQTRDAMARPKIHAHH